MRIYAEHFIDVILVDSTYQRNRFNLVLVNVLGISNYGKSVLLAFGLLSNEKKESYDWFFSHLKKSWRRNEPKNIITDEDDSIQYGIVFIKIKFNTLIGISKNFKCRFLLCGWHLQKNLRSKFTNLSRSDPDLYKKILKLPFTLKKEEFEEIVDLVSDSKDVSEAQINYLDGKLLCKTKWARCFIKNEFAGGVSTTSRVEVLHSLQKKNMTSSSSLQKVFHSFRLLEKRQISKFSEEYNEATTYQSIEGTNSLKPFKKTILRMCIREFRQNMFLQLITKKI